MTPGSRFCSRSRQRASALAFLLAAAATATATSARAETGRLNVHVQPSYSLVLGGVLSDLAPAGGPGVTLRVDVAIISMLAVEVGYTYDLFLVDDSSGLVTAKTLGLQHFGGGLRANILDDRRGYLGEPGGSILGTLWVAAHAGYGLVPSSGGLLGALTIDGTVGYDLSLFKPLSLGLFARFTRYFVSVELTGETRLEGINLLSFGLDVSLAFGASPRGGRTGGNDSDRDGLSDAEEEELGTDPTLADTDGDGIPDGIEKNGAAKSDPNSGDTDADGLGDGEEDKNRDGTIGPGETDPAKADTDGGGVSDGAEVKFGMDPLVKGDDNPDLILKAAGADASADTDLDGVFDSRDRCLGTPEGEAVDSAGCLPLADVEVIFGLGFKGAELDPATLPILDRWVRVLADHPEATIEIGGHADGKKTKEKDLIKWSIARADAVKARFVAAGVPAERLLTKGYGGTVKADPARTAAAIEANNRVELKTMAAAPVPASGAGPAPDASPAPAVVPAPAADGPALSSPGPAGTESAPADAPKKKGKGKAKAKAK